MILKIAIMVLFLGAAAKATYNDIIKENKASKSPLNWPEKNKI